VILYGLFLQGTKVTQMMDVVGSLHNTVLQIFEATFLPDIIEMGQNLAKILQKLKA